MSTMPPEDLNVPEEDPDVPVESPDEETTHEASQLEALAGELVETVETHVVEGISRLARFGIRFRRGITLTLLLVILAVVVVAQTGRGQELALRTALDRLDGVLAGELIVRGIRSGTLLTGATLTDVRLDAAGGRSFLQADSVVLRYSLVSYIMGGAAVRSTILWGLDLEISRYEGEEAPNVAGILAESAPDSAARSADLPLQLGRIGVREGRVRILSPQVSGSTAPTVIGPSGEQLRQLAFEDLDLDLENAILVRSSAVPFEARLASFSSAVHLRLEPLRLREVFGNVSFGAQGIRVWDAAFRMPMTLMRGDLTVGPVRPGEPWTFRSTLEADGWGELSDLQWIDERIPTGRFRGGADVSVLDAVVMDFDGFEVELEASHVIADGEVTFQDGMSMNAVEVSASPIVLDRLEPWLGIEFPIDGWLSGQATFGGSLDDLMATGRLTLVPTGLGGDPTTADFSGVIHSGVNPGATDFEANVRPFNYTVLEALWPEFPFSGTGGGHVELDGRVDGGLMVVADITHEAVSADTTIARVSGIVARDPEFGWATDLSVDFTPLSVGVLASLAPDLGLRGAVSGPVSIRGPLDNTDIRAELVAGDGSVVVEANIDLLAPAYGYRFGAEADQFPITAFSSRLPEPSVWSGRLDVAGTGFVPDSMGVSAIVTAHGSRVGSVRVDTVSAGFRLVDGVLFTDSLNATIAGIDINGRGRLGFAPGRYGDTDFEFAGESLVGLRPALMGLSDSVMVRDALSPLDRDFLRLEGIEPDTLPTAEEVRMEGRVSGVFTVTGEIREFGVGAVAEIVQGAYRSNQVDSARVGLTASGLPAMPRNWQLGVSGNGIQWGSRRFEQGGFEADMAERIGIGRVEVVRSEGEHYGATGSVRLDSIGGELGLERVEFVIDDQRWDLARQGTLTWDGSTLSVDSVQIERQGEEPMQLLVDGALARGGESDFHISVEGLFLERALHAAQLDHLEIGGRLDLGVIVHGPSEAPIVDGTFFVQDPRYGAMRLSRVAGSLEYADRVASFEVDGWDGVREAIHAGGDMPMDLAFTDVDDRVPDGPLDIRITADSLDAAIALAYVGALDDVLGLVSGDILISGTTATPAPDGSVDLTDGAWSIEALGVRHTGVNGNMRLRPDRTVDVSLGTTEIGSSSVTGTMLLEPLRDPLLDLQFDFDQFVAVGRPDMEGLISGEFDLTGRYSRPLAEGALTVNQGTIFVDELQRAAGVVDLSDPFLFEGGIAVDTTALVAQPLLAGLRNPFFDNLRVNVDLSVPSDTWLRSTMTNVEMAGDLLVTYDRRAGDFVLIGELVALRGSHVVANRSFELDGGAVTFIGRPGFNPDLDIQASSRIRRRNEEPLEISALVQGTVVRPIVTVSTEEAGLAESDLYAYLLLGTSSDAIGAQNGQLLGDLGRSPGMSAIEGALTFYSGALANQLGPVLGRFVGVDYVSVQQGGGHGFDQSYLRDTQFEIGSYVGDEMFLVVVLRPNQGGDATEQNNLAGIRVEWAFTDDYNVEAFMEDRFLRSGSATLGASGLLQDDQIWGVLFFRDWGY
jgi:hypothetical protein